MENNNRYLRQLAIPGFDETAQQRLAESHILIVGCGALGSIAAMYLAGAGIGHLTIADFDTVDITNLHRQLFYQTSDIGANKSDLLRQRIIALNPDVTVTALNQKITETEALRLAADSDLILDCTDNAETKYILERIAIAAERPITIAGISNFHGQIMSVRPGSTKFSAIFPETHPSTPTDPTSQPPLTSEISEFSDSSESPTSDTTLSSGSPAPENSRLKGVFGPAAGTAACLQAAEAVKILTGLGQPLYDRLLTFDLLTSTLRTLTL